MKTSVIWNIQINILNKSSRPHLPELVEGDGVVLVGVGLLDGSLSDALQLLLRHLQAEHRPQHLRVTVVHRVTTLSSTKLPGRHFSVSASSKLTHGEPQGSTLEPLNFYQMIHD